MSTVSQETLCLIDRWVVAANYVRSEDARVGTTQGLKCRPYKQVKSQHEFSSWNQAGPTPCCPYFDNIHILVSARQVFCIIMDAAAAE